MGSERQCHISAHQSGPCSTLIKMQQELNCLFMNCLFLLLKRKESAVFPAGFKSKKWQHTVCSCAFHHRQWIPSLWLCGKFSVLFQLHSPPLQSRFLREPYLKRMIVFSDIIGHLRCSICCSLFSSQHAPSQTLASLIYMANTGNPATPETWPSVL